jgi:hypothetical protein
MSCFPFRVFVSVANHAMTERVLLGHINQAQRKLAQRKLTMKRSRAAPSYFGLFVPWLAGYFLRRALASSNARRRDASSVRGLRRRSTGCGFLRFEKIEKI